MSSKINRCEVVPPPPPGPPPPVATTTTSPAAVLHGDVQVPAAVASALAAVARHAGRELHEIFMQPITPHLVEGMHMLRVPLNMEAPTVPLPSKDFCSFCGFHAAPWNAVVGICRDRTVLGTDYVQEWPGSGQVTFWSAAMELGSKEEWRFSAMQQLARVARSTYCTAGAAFEGTWASVHKSIKSGGTHLAISLVGASPTPFSVSQKGHKWKAVEGRWVHLRALWITNKDTFATFGVSSCPSLFEGPSSSSSGMVFNPLPAGSAR